MSGVRGDTESPVPNEGSPRAEGETLAAVVTALARRLSDATLAALTGGGVLGAAVVALVVPSRWRLLLPPFAMLAALGAWGIADRERGAAGSRRIAFAVVRSIAVLVGIAAALALAMAALRVALGTWIS